MPTRSASMSARFGEGGAEQLLGRGDMLYMAGGGRVTRVHGPFVSRRGVSSASSRFLKELALSLTNIDEITPRSRRGFCSIRSPARTMC